MSYGKVLLSSLGRVQRIGARLAEGRMVSAAELAREEEVSTKTVYRVVDFLRDHLQWQIEGGPRGFICREKLRWGFFCP